jgi:broad specificity phosphatase PhoE
MVNFAKRQFSIITAAVVSAAALGLLSPVSANDKLWGLLQKGGQVVLIRHALTTPGAGDPPGMRLDDCSTQRNLSQKGREQAQQLGAAFRVRGIPVDRVLSSPWCRCLDTARLAFGKAEISQSLGNLFDRPENQDKQVREMRALADAWRGPGNLLLVSHGSTIQALTGVSPEPAEMVILTPRANGRFNMAGRFSVGPP